MKPVPGVKLPFKKPDYFDFAAFGSMLSSLFTAGSSVAGSIITSNATTKQNQAQIDAQLEALRLQSGNAQINPANDSTKTIMVIVIAVILLLIVGLVIWMIVRK